MFGYFTMAEGVVVTSPLPPLPDPESVTGPASASEALSSALAAVATASQNLGAAPHDSELVRELHPGRAVVAFEDLKTWIGNFHELLVKIAAEHAQLTSWSVTVGTPFDLTLTVNFTDNARADLVSGFVGPDGNGDGNDGHQPLP
jgi:hypothetical protein